MQQPRFKVNGFRQFPWLAEQDLIAFTASQVGKGFVICLRSNRRVRLFGGSFQPRASSPIWDLCLTLNPTWCFQNVEPGQTHQSYRSVPTNQVAGDFGVRNLVLNHFQKSPYANPLFSCLVTFGKTLRLTPLWKPLSRLAAEARYRLNKKLEVNGVKSHCRLLAIELRRNDVCWLREKTCTT